MKKLIDDLKFVVDHMKIDFLTLMIGSEITPRQKDALRHMVSIKHLEIIKEIKRIL